MCTTGRPSLRNRSAKPAVTETAWSLSGLHVAAPGCRKSSWTSIVRRAARSHCGTVYRSDIAGFNAFGYPVCDFRPLRRAKYHGRHGLEKKKSPDLLSRRRGPQAPRPHVGRGTTGQERRQGGAEERTMKRHRNGRTDTRKGVAPVQAKIAVTGAALFASLATLMAIRDTAIPCSRPSKPCSRS